MRGAHGGLLRGGVFGKPSEDFTPLVSEIDQVNFTLGVMSIRGPIMEVAIKERRGKIWVWKMYYVNLLELSGKKYASAEEAMGAMS